MVGPVLYLEMLLGGRRGRQRIFRYLYAGWLIIELLIFWVPYWLEHLTRQSIFNPLPPDPNATSVFATSFIRWFIIRQLIITLLITPAYTAGAITDEKTRGTLQFMFTAHLTAAEIVIGKLLGRMAQVGLLILTGLPVLCFIGVFAGLQPTMLFAVFVVTVAPVFALGAASLLASVWARQTRDAVLSLYFISGVVFLLCLGAVPLETYLRSITVPGAPPGLGLSLVIGFNEIFRYFNPLYVLEPGWGNGDMAQLGRRLVGSTVVWSGVGAVCLGLAIWRLRSAYIRQLENSGRKTLTATIRRRGAIGDDPIRWKERQVEGIAPVAVLRVIPSALGMGLIFSLTVISSGLLLRSSFKKPVALSEIMRLVSRLDLPSLAQMVDDAAAGPLFAFQAIVAMLMASLIVGIRSSGAVSGERERQTWEALLLTPLETRQLIRGKIWGIFGAALRYLVAYAVPALLLALVGGFAAFFWTTLGLGVTLLAMYYMGAAGIFASVRARGSWQSLLMTMGFGYVGGFLLFVITGPVVLIVAGIIYIVLTQIVDKIFNLGISNLLGTFGEFFSAFLIASCLSLAAIFYLVSWWFVADAEKRVSDRERTRHWKDEQVYRPRRRLPVAPARFYQ